MVSVSLFLVVMVIALGAVLAIIDGNKKTQAINSVSNNLNSAIESMVRDIKTGFAYSCGEPSDAIESRPTAYDAEFDTCDPTSENVTESISFVSTISGGKRWVNYKLEDRSGTGRQSIIKTFCPASNDFCGTGDYVSVPITSPDIDINTLEFRIRRPFTLARSPAGDDVGQPSVFISIKGTAAVNKTTVSDFSMQTFVSQRVLNI
jgi:hypothetical protein